MFGVLVGDSFAILPVCLVFRLVFPSNSAMSLYVVYSCGLWNAFAKSGFPCPTSAIMFDVCSVCCFTVVFSGGRCLVFCWTFSEFSVLLRGGVPMLS